MDGAKVGIFEDNTTWQRLFGMIVEGAGHSVVVRATTIDDADYVIRNLKPGDINVALVDGNLSKGISDGAEGAEIARQLHLRLPGIFVIGVTGSFNDVEDVDASVHKSRVDEQLNDIIGSL